MHINQNVIEVVHSLYSSKRESGYSLRKLERVTPWFASMSAYKDPSTH